MIESELKAYPQFKSADKVEPKADRKAKAKGAASLFNADKELNHLEKAWSETANEMKAMQKILQDITTWIGHLQQNRSPQPIPSTNDMNPTNQGNNNTQTRGRGFYRGRRGRNRGRGQSFYQDIPPICWWCKGNVSREETQHRIQDCPIYKECRENWWTHPTNSNTTTPSNPEQEGKPGRESIEEVQEGSLDIDDPPQKSYIHVTHAKTKKKTVLGERRVKTLLKFRWTSKFKRKRNSPIIPSLMLGEG